MLIEFRVENHRSIRDEQAFTMEASLLEDEADTRPRAVDGHDKKLLPVAALYGANASGKTNVLAAMDFMQEAVIFSHRSWAPDEGIPRSPFAWGEKRKEPSEYVVTFLVEGVRHEYGFVANDEAFEEEWLFAWPNGKKQSWFERDGKEFKFGEYLKGENKLTARVTRTNSLFLSAAIQNEYVQLQPVFDWFGQLRIDVPNPRRRFVLQSEHYYYRIVKMLEMPLQEEPKNVAKRELVSGLKDLIRGADLGIRDVQVEYQSATWASGQDGKTPVLIFQHSLQDIDAWLPWSAESRGTQTMIRHALPVLEVLRNGGVFVVDELEASLHPMLAATIVQQFNDPKTNPKNAQLIFTTHDTNLLGRMFDPPLLRRDQVWFTEKKKEGGTMLYPLTDFKPRKEENVERGYLQGRYGAVPFLDEFQLLTENSK